MGQNNNLNKLRLMELIIKNNNNYFKLKGKLVKYNIHLFNDEFENIFDENNNITINITELDKIDSYGINAIAKLHNKAVSRNKKLSIIGMGSPDLFKHSTQEEPKESMIKKLSNFYTLQIRSLIMPFVDA